MPSRTRAACRRTLCQANASVLYMVRANKVADSVKLQKRVDAIAEGAALMTGTSYERVFIDGTAETLPNFTLEALLHASFAETGVPQYTAEELAFASSLCRTFPPQTRAPGIGAKFDSEIAKKSRAFSENMTKPMNDFLLPLYSGEGFLPGSTDVGDVSWQTPTAQALIAAWPAGVPGHSWQVVACGKTSLAHKAILCAGKLWQPPPSRSSTIPRCCKRPARNTPGEPDPATSAPSSRTPCRSRSDIPKYFPTSGPPVLCPPDICFYSLSKSTVYSFLFVFPRLRFINFINHCILFVNRLDFASDRC